MKIIETAEGYALKVTESEMLNIYGSLLFSLAKHKRENMPITTSMAKSLQEFFEKPF